MQQKNAILYTTLFAPEDRIEFSKKHLRRLAFDLIKQLQFIIALFFPFTVHYVL